MLKILKYRYIVFAFLFFSFSASALNVPFLAGSSIASVGALGIVMSIATGVATIATGGSVALLALGASILFTLDGSAPTSETTAPLTITLNPNKSLITPTGWSDPVAPATQPTPPNSTPITTTFRLGISPSPPLPAGSDKLKVCESALGRFAGGVAITSAALNANGNCALATDLPWVAWPDVPFSNVDFCPTGYISIGTSCALSSPAAVIKPIQNRQGIIRTGNEFAIDPQINPADVLPSSSVSVTPKTVTVHAKDGSSAVATINADGSLTLTNSMPLAGTSNSKTTTTTFASPDPDGNVQITGKSETTTAGQGVSATGAVAALDISSLNKESTQAAILDKATKTEANTKAISDNLNCVDCPEHAPTYAGDKFAVDGEVKKTTDALGAINHEDDENLFLGLFVPTFATSSCTPFSKSIAGKVIVLDPCETVGKINELFGWLYALFGSWSIVGLIFRRTS